MKTLYIDCGMGAAGDMLTAALLELFPDPQGAVDALNALGIPGVAYRLEKAEKCGIRGTHVSVLVHGHEEDDRDCGDHHHDHADMGWIRDTAAALAVPEGVRRNVLAVYDLIAAAEAKVHGVPVEAVHFHEVGALDAVADITAVCWLLDRLAPDRIVSSPVHVGSGSVRCTHGILPVPAPATAELLRGVPIYGGEIAGELCTPTGAALLKHFASSFGPMPCMAADAVGYGMGKKDFPRANCVRVLLGESAGGRDTVAVLACNVDDMTAEEIGFATEMLLAAGARDVYTAPIGMKKNRPGTLIRVICSPEDKERMARLLFRHTTTIGIRETEMGRYVLDRQLETSETPLGAVRVKKTAGYGVAREKYEYEDLARIAAERELSLAEARALLERNTER